MNELFASLRERALKARLLVLTTSARAGSVHIASSLSPIDILTALYFDIMHLGILGDADYDKFIFSKGHGGVGFYAVLAERGLISMDLLETYGQNGTILAVHPVRGSVPWIEATTGSLGHGLGMGLGLALAQKRDGKTGRTFVIVSDGECDEGSTWEAIMLAGHLKLDNFIAIVDYNKIQSFGSVKEVLDLEPFADKWRANHWEAVEIDGHDFKKIVPVLRNIPITQGKPTVVIAHTIKGKGVPSMENKLEWHYRNIKLEDLAKFLKEVY